MDFVRIGLIGCGGIARGKHMGDYSHAQGGKVVAVCDINEQRMNEVGDKYGIPAELRFRDYHDLIACSEVDAVDICTPNYLHVPMATAAVNAGKPFCVEKPLGISYAETVELQKLADEKNIKSMICFSYRFWSAMRYARYLADQGILGNVVNVYAQYLKSSTFMPGRRLDWRFVEELARYGVSGDLGVHILDLTTFLAGDVTAITADTGITVKERKREDSEEIAKVTTDDWCHFLARFKNGASGTFSITRSAYGNANYIRVDVYGDKGAFRFDNGVFYLRRPEDPIDKFTKTDVPAEFSAGQQQTFINLLLGKEDKYIPKLADGVRMQRVLDAILESDATRQWVNI